MLLLTNNVNQLLSTLLMFLNWRSLQSSNTPRDLLAPNYEFLYKIQRLQQNGRSCPNENVLDQKIHIRLMHDLLHKSDKCDNLLATLTAFEFSQLTVLQSEKQIKFMSD
jgi:hypothetical protein